MGRLAAAVLSVALLTAGCATAEEPGTAPAEPSDGTTSAPVTPSTPAVPSPSPTVSQAPTVSPSAQPARPEPGTVPPRWLGTRVLPVDAQGFGQVRPTPRELRNRRFTLPDTLPPLPGLGFASRVTRVPDRVLARSTWQRGCPVAAEDLRWVRLTFHGFDGRRHTGELLVHESAAGAMVRAFRRLYHLRFPIEEMRITRRDELGAPPTGDGNDTGVFVCRPAVGQTTFSQHAYGLAVDINPFHNPYVKGDLVLPELASAYVDRTPHRPGMITPAVVAAFAAVGWEWGGAWQSSKDYQHFSANGR